MLTADISDRLFSVLDRVQLILYYNIILLYTIKHIVIMHYAIMSFLLLVFANAFLILWTISESNSNKLYKTLSMYYYVLCPVVSVNNGWHLMSQNWMTPDHLSFSFLLTIIDSV